MYRVQKRNYGKYGTELLRFDPTHALLDFAATVMATAGIVLTTYTGSYVVELAFTLVLLFFVVHSVIEVMRDNLMAILGTNRDVKLET